MLASEVISARERLAPMFANLTPAERRNLAAHLHMASLDTLAEVASAVELGRVQFDALYGAGRAAQYPRMAAEQVMLLTDLVTASTLVTD